MTVQFLNLVFGYGGSWNKLSDKTSLRLDRFLRKVVLQVIVKQFDQSPQTLPGLNEKWLTFVRLGDFHWSNGSIH